MCAYIKVFANDAAVLSEDERVSNVTGEEGHEGRPHEEMKASKY